MSASLPDRKTNVVGRDLEGNMVELSYIAAPRLYVCPSCREEIPIGSSHVLVRYTPDESAPFHQHWHTECVKDELVRDIRDAVTKPAERGPGRGARRAQALERRRAR